MREINGSTKYMTDTASIKRAENDIGRYMPAIKALPVFAGIEEKLIVRIVKDARIESYNKGSVIFLQNEPAGHLYIVLNGWVKIFKSNAGGEEAVLQVMTDGESMVEVIFSSHGLYSVSAQAVEISKILVIPASVIHEYISVDNRLALNILSAVAGRSQHLTSQFEQLTLKTVTQRAGRFLLKLLLESKKRTGKIALPYDKALIAAYLGMQPETFSRVLLHFKEQGMNIERDAVFLPDLFALCGYCDTELANRCPRHNTPECPLRGRIN